MKDDLEKRGFSGLKNQKHTITEWLRLEGTSGGHLVQTPCSSRAT